LEKIGSRSKKKLDQAPNRNPFRIQAWARIGMRRRGSIKEGGEEGDSRLVWQHKSAEATGETLPQNANSEVMRRVWRNPGVWSPRGLGTMKRSKEKDKRGTRVTRQESRGGQKILKRGAPESVPLSTGEIGVKCSGRQKCSKGKHRTGTCILSENSSEIVSDRCGDIRDRRPPAREMRPTRLGEGERGGGFRQKQLRGVMGPNMGGLSGKQKPKNLPEEGTVFSKGRKNRKKA